MDKVDMNGYCHLNLNHYISKNRTQRLERTNGTLRLQTGRWHRQQNKFGKQWEFSKGNGSIAGELLQLDVGA